MGTDIAFADGPQQRIGDGVKTDIRIRMAFEAKFMGHSDPAQHDMIAGAEAVHIEPQPGPRLAGAEKPLGADHVPGPGDFDVVFRSFDDGDGQPGAFGNGGVIGQFFTAGLAVGVEDFLITESLWRLRPPQPLAVDGGLDELVVTPLQGIGDGKGRDGAGRCFQGRQHPRDDAVIDQRPGGVVNQHR